MSYFNDHYGNINYPQLSDESPGLRNAQLGAIFSISAFFTLQKKLPALIVMPTGSGKTTVLIITAFTQKSKRVLVITPSVLVRGQIYEEFSTLNKLKELGVCHTEMATPKVFEIKGFLKSNESIQNLKNFDVIISTPNSIFQAFKDNLDIPTDLFDLILIDEAHHSSAKSWETVITHFEDAKKVLFTATPFRRDKKEIKGDIIYAYPLSKAFEDKIFGELYFYPLKENELNRDILLAETAEKIFNSDRDEGFEHFLFVRTNTKQGAKELFNIYKQNTKLNLRVIDSNKTYRYIKSTITKLKNKELDGIICVDMLGEGFDFPNLKIAAIHTPHKSLAATLQFIGRFARTNATNLGEAKFIAFEDQELEIENTVLYRQDTIWKEKIIDMSEGKIHNEGEIKKVLNTFKAYDNNVEVTNTLSIYNLYPYFHVKIYETDNFYFNKNIVIPFNTVVEFMISEEHNALLIISEEITKPKWLSTNDLQNIRYNLFIVYYDKETNLLFINSSLKSIEFYDQFSQQFSHSKLNRLSKSQINRVLADIDNPEFFNIGLANRMNNSGETYKILTGPSAQNVLNKSDGRLYSNGHIFGRGISGGTFITIGYSSGSKIWSNCYDQVPDFINWCKLLGSKICSDKLVKTNSALDDLPLGKIITQFPSKVYCLTWNHVTYVEPPILQFIDNSGIENNYQLLDFDLNILNQQPGLIEIEITNGFQHVVLSYDFQSFYKTIKPSSQNVNLLIRSKVLDLDSYLNENPLTFYLQDNFSMIMNHELHSPPETSIIPFDKNHIMAFNWDQYNTDITQECGSSASIHETLKTYLCNDNQDLVIYDHGTGEIADFVTVKNLNEIIIHMYHVKASHGQVASNRVSDVYEVVGQAVKSLIWINNKQSFIKNLKRRTENYHGKFIVGNISDFTTIMSESKRLLFQICIVQPGISKDNLTPKIAELLASCDAYIKSSGNKNLNIIGSQ